MAAGCSPPLGHKGFPPPNPFLRIYRAPACLGAVFFRERRAGGRALSKQRAWAGRRWMDHSRVRCQPGKPAHLPEIETGTSYGTPALKVRGKLFQRVKDPDTLVLMCPLEEKKLLMAAAPHIYYETDHCKGGRACPPPRASLAAQGAQASRRIGCAQRERTQDSAGSHGPRVAPITETCVIRACACPRCGMENSRGIAKAAMVSG
jgi:hypothetical protein